jgi:ParB-like chromosome segregation protein Spo0J
LVGVAAQDEMELATERRQRDGVEVDLHQLELRHRDLRIHDGEQRRRLIGSVAEIGQQVPVVVIRDADRLVLIDGYLRVEALRRLHRDTAIATAWPVTETEALVHHRQLAGGKSTALEDAWLLARLREHGLTMDQLAHRLCRSKSWVSRRLGLLEVLVASAQDRVRAGSVPAQAAMKYLVPLARANKRQCEQLIAGLGDTQVSVRELGALYVAWKRADRPGKQRIVAEPLLVLRALAALAEEPEDEAAVLHKDLTMLAAVALRAGRRARDGGRFTAPLTKAWRAASEAFAALGATIEEMHAGPDDSTNHPEPA